MEIITIVEGSVYKVISGDVIIQVNRFVRHDPKPIESLKGYFAELIKTYRINPINGFEQSGGWTIRDSRTKKFLVKNDYGIHFFYSISVKKLRETVGNSRKAKIILAPKGW